MKVKPDLLTKFFHYHCLCPFSSIIEWNNKIFQNIQIFESERNQNVVELEFCFAFYHFSLFWFKHQGTFMLLIIL